MKRHDHAITASFVLAFLVLFCRAPIAYAQEAEQESVRLWEEDIVMPSYRLEAPDKNPMFYRNEVYQGAQKRIYPYPFQEHVTNLKEERPFRFVFLENEYIKLSILPEIGGRLFSALDKTNGYDFFYRQSVIKPALIGMLGAWISGGVEWCVFHHHRNTTHMPVDYTLAENSDGSKTVWIGETERRQRMRWMIGITLYPGRAYVEATVRLINQTPLAHSMLYWANVAVHVNDEYQVIFPPSVRYATYHSKNDFVHWPIANEEYRGVDYTGVDLTWWKNHPEPVSFFAWNLQEDFMGGYDHGRDAGVVHVANHHIVSGAKLWEWSPGPRGRMWDKILTDTDGPYAELMVGAYSDNQPDYSWIKPYEVRTFKQYWYPVKGIGGFKNANLDAAVNLEIKDGKARIGFSSTREFRGAIALFSIGRAVVYQQRIDLAPDRPFTHNFTLPPGIKETDLGVLLVDQSRQPIISYRPKTAEYDPDLPDVVQPPKNPSDIKTVEELYLTGLRVQQIHNPSVDPEAYYREALRRDPGDTRTNTIVAANLIKRGLYEKAEAHLRRALERLTAEYMRPRNGEAHYLLGLALRMKQRFQEAYEQFYRASWDQAFTAAANYELAELSCLKQDFSKALEQVETSLKYSGDNPKAQALRLVILRKLERQEEAREDAAALIERDPLMFWARNEQILLTPKDEQQPLLDEFNRLMRDDPQNFLELAADYARSGLWVEAINILDRAISSESAASRFPMIHYYRGFYLMIREDEKRALESFEKAASLPSDYCFPFRLESIEILKAAIERLPENPMAYYYLGNLLYEIQPDRAVEAWEKARELDPNFARNHRNLGWAYYWHQGDPRKAAESYEQAVKADPTDPRYFLELDRLYERLNVSAEKRLKLMEENREVIESTANTLQREIMVRVLLGRYAKAIEDLDNHFFHVREGGGEIHDVFVDAHLLRGIDLLSRDETEAALRDFLRAAEYPENLSVGVPRRDRRLPQVAYYTGLAYEKKGDREKAIEFFRRAAEADINDAWAEARFFQAQAFAKLGEQDKAARIYDALIAFGERILQQPPEVDYFAKFGEQETEPARKARGYYILGLGRLGRGETDAAAEALENSVQLDVSNVWAKYQLGKTSS